MTLDVGLIDAVKKISEDPHAIGFVRYCAESRHDGRFAGTFGSTDDFGLAAIGKLNQYAAEASRVQGAIDWTKFLEIIT